MRFVTAVALAAVMLWVPVDGVAREISLYDSEGEAVAYYRSLLLLLLLLGIVSCSAGSKIWIDRAVAKHERLRATREEKQGESSPSSSGSYRPWLTPIRISSFTLNLLLKRC